MAAKTERDRLAAENSRLRHALAREGRLLFLGAVAILLIAGGIGTFVFFRHLAYGDLVARGSCSSRFRPTTKTSAIRSARRT